MSSIEEDLHDLSCREKIWDTASDSIFGRDLLYWVTIQPPEARYTAYYHSIILVAEEGYTSYNSLQMLFCDSPCVDVEDARIQHALAIISVGNYNTFLNYGSIGRIGFNV
jgi:hypothetical protein